MRVDDPIHFEKPEDFRNRPMFSSPLIIDKDDLDLIVGKYYFTEEIACSLNGCTTPHKWGFVIRSKDGRETNCGHMCGKRDFGVAWNEVHASFKKAEQLQAARQVLAELLNDRDDLFLEITKIIPRLEMALSAKSYFLSKTGSTGGFNSQLINCIKLGGAIRAQRPQTEHEIKNGIRAPFVTVERIKGGSVVFSEDFWNLPTTLSTNSLQWIKSLDPSKILQLNDESMNGILKEAKVHRSLLNKAKKFVDDAEVFFSKENEKAFEAVRLCLMRKGYERDNLENPIKEWGLNPRGVK